MILQKTFGIEHGLLTTLVNRVPKSKRFKNVDAKRKDELEKKVVHDSELVEVKYINYKNQSTGQRRVDWTAAAGEPYFIFNFLHDHTYTIPRGVVEVVNDPSKKRPQRADSLDESGRPRVKDGPGVRIDEFVKVF
jgi:hypothetical protein